MSFEDLEWGEGSPKHFNVSQTTTTTSSKAVVTGVFKINTAVASFVRLHNSLGTPKDTVQLRHKLYVNGILGCAIHSDIRSCALVFKQT